jgi:hypothetical protein
VGGERAIIVPGDRRAIARRATDRLRLLKRRPGSTLSRANFDEVRVETELYDQLYGRRTGTVENITPLTSALGAPSVRRRDRKRESASRPSR